MADDADSVDEQLNSRTDVAADDAPATSVETPQNSGGESEHGADTPVGQRHSGIRLALAVGLAAVLASAGLCGWLGYRAYQAQHVERQRALFVQVGRQAALNLTTINYAEADADVQRILDSATGNFYDNFHKRAPAFIDVVKQAQSKSQGSVTEAGLESVDGNQAQVLVAVTVKTSNAAAPEGGPRLWRMRISVQKVSRNDAKVSNVQFVP